MTKSASALVPWLALALVAAGCGPTTRLGAVWSASEPAPTPFTNVLVVGIGTESASRRLFEDRFSAALLARGTRAESSWRHLPSESILSEAELGGQVRAGGYDAVVVTRLLAVDNEQRVVPPRTGVSVGVGSGGYYGHYGTSWGINYSPGYVSNTTTVRLETKIFETRGNGLVWTAESDTFQPADTESAVQSVTQTLVKRLAQDGWIR
ncbi:MAG: hypothetical protein QNK05_14620 [Myxococcota bacterium]|nr:hypothetical protein [Myxococcota bacterium]